MRLGRNFTNTLIYDLLTDDQKKSIADGSENLFSMNAWGLLAFKDNVEYQLKRITELGLDHIELDCDVPNPYAGWSDERCAAIKKAAADAGVTLSVHLTYSNAGSSVVSLQELDRNAAVDIQKAYLDFGKKVGAKYSVLHPGSAPFYYCAPIYLKQFNERLLMSLRELCPYATERGIAFHVENNVSFDNLYVEPEDCIAVVQQARDEGLECYFNFDIGHWFTRGVQKKELPDPPESVMERLSKEMIKEIHLNDFVTEGIIFHPPLHEEIGPLKRANLENYATLLKALEPECIVLETAFKRLDQVLNREKILIDETAYVKEIFGL